MSSNRPDADALAQRFRPIFQQIAEAAPQREHERRLAHDAIDALRQAGFGALRVPRAHGGLGATPEQLFDLLIELAEADSNLPQALRAHFGFVERLQAEIDAERRVPWLRRVADGALFGNATTEAGEGTLGRLQTRLFRENGRWLLEGEKFYSTGTLYADWVSVTAQREGNEPGAYRTLAVVRTDAAGVERLDDWRGFGQRLTASGTTRLHRVEVPEENILEFPAREATSLPAVFQLFHVATLAGIAWAIVRDATVFVQGRKRVFSHGSGTAPREYPLVQQVIGQLEATAYLARLAVQDVARALGDIDRLRQAGQPVPEAALVDVELRATKAQVVTTDAVLQAATRLFDVGGATALQEDRRLDRHWRNARTLASHNPVIYKARVLGDHTLNASRPTFYWAVGTAA
ncbi:acyl-CoA dehydrogenase family protein [uncultured Pseudacidovorax sp.]|uniref:acyl-CoA dehydrogenase family protein n=1 Tax=uncultured Pseudacidovorax sp. TaxID=679313 RepID=UPI0025DB5821|nr:acyl-CoA dehydrogenase family protein [uncultured Pseudacidovorax sp.]